MIESGYGSGSVEHHWKRLEGGDDELRLVGCDTSPFVQTDDVTNRSSVIVAKRPAAAFDRIQVRLTVSDDRRVLFDSTEGVLTL